MAGQRGARAILLVQERRRDRLFLDRDDSPWYPIVHLFRQTATREYASVLDRVRAEPLTRISTFNG